MGEKYRFDIGGDLKEALKVSGSLEYISYWLRDKLKMFENGQIKIIRSLTGERSWEYEEKIKKQMWEDVNVNRKFHGSIPFSSGCTQTEVTVTSPSPSYSSPKDPCFIS